MTCDSFWYQAGQRAPIVTMQNVQIVNGGQTSNALFEAYREAPERVKKALILTRIYETKTKEISSDIAESTNSQTPINTRNLRSNDDVQKKLEESFRDIGLLYERKAKQYAEHPRSKRVDALAAGQAFLAYHLGIPEVAKKDRSRVFSDLYENIFNDNITPTKLLTPLRIFEEIEKRKRALQKLLRAERKVNFTTFFLIDGAYHVLFAVCQICETNKINIDNEELAKTQISPAMDVIADLVKSAVRSGEFFTFNRFFKDAKTKVKIQAAISKQPSSKGSKSISRSHSN